MKKLISFDADTLDGNHHGPNSTILRSGFKIVRMGSYAKMWSLYIYRRDGRAHRITVAFPRWLGPWPESAGGEPRRSNHDHP